MPLFKVHRIIVLKNGGNRAYQRQGLHILRVSEPNGEVRQMYLGFVPLDCDARSHRPCLFQMPQQDLRFFERLEQQVLQISWMKTLSISKYVVGHFYVVGYQSQQSKRPGFSWVQILILAGPTALERTFTRTSPPSYKRALERHDSSIAVM